MPRGSDTYWIPLGEMESPGQYADFFADTLIAIVRANDGHESDYQLPLTPKQRLMLSALLEVVGRDGEPEAMVPALEDLLFSLCKERSLENT